MINPADQTSIDAQRSHVGGEGTASDQGWLNAQDPHIGRSPRYFLQRQGRSWKEVDPAVWVATERELGLGMHGVISPITSRFEGISRLTGQTVRGRTVTDVYAIVGSRRWHDNLGGLQRAQEIIEARLSYGHDGPRPDAVVSGHAVGIDRLGEDIAEALDLVVIRRLPRVYRFHGPGGFRERDEQIAQDATRGLCIRSKTSTTYGSGWTARRMEELGKPVERIVI